MGVEASGGEGGVVPLSLPAPPRSNARSLPPFQVPSASRRGGLKTPWGVARPPWVGGGRARGVRGEEVRTGERGGHLRCPPSPRLSLLSPPQTPLISPWERRKPPGRLWGLSRGTPLPRTAPWSHTFPAPQRVWSRLSRAWTAARGASFHPPLGRGGEERKGFLAVPGSGNRKKKKNFTTLSGGSLGSCVDEERS